MPNASGLAIMPRFSARTEALRAYTPRDLTLHRADGSPVPTRTISLRDCEELRRLADELPLSGPAPDAEPSEPWRSEPDLHGWADGEEDFDPLRERYQIFVELARRAPEFSARS